MSSMTPEARAAFLRAMEEEAQKLAALSFTEAPLPAPKVSAKHDEVIIKPAWNVEAAELTPGGLTDVSNGAPAAASGGVDMDREEPEGKDIEDKSVGGSEGVKKGMPGEKGTEKVDTWPDIKNDARPIAAMGTLTAGAGETENDGVGNFENSLQARKEALSKGVSATGRRKQEDDPTPPLSQKNLEGEPEKDMVGYAKCFTPENETKNPGQHMEQATAFPGRVVAVPKVTKKPPVAYPLNNIFGIKNTSINKKLDEQHATTTKAAVPVGETQHMSAAHQLPPSPAISTPSRTSSPIQDIGAAIASVAESSNSQTLISDKALDAPVKRKENLHLENFHKAILGAALSSKSSTGTKPSRTLAEEVALMKARQAVEVRKAKAEQAAKDATNEAAQKFIQDAIEEVESPKKKRSKKKKAASITQNYDSKMEIEGSPKPKTTVKTAPAIIEKKDLKVFLSELLKHECNCPLTVSPPNLDGPDFEVDVDDDTKIQLLKALYDIMFALISDYHNQRFYLAPKPVNLGVWASTFLGGSTFIADQVPFTLSLPAREMIISKIDEFPVLYNAVLNEEVWSLARILKTIKDMNKLATWLQMSSKHVQSLMTMHDIVVESMSVIEKNIEREKQKIRRKAEEIDEVFGELLVEFKAFVMNEREHRHRENDMLVEGALGKLRKLVGGGN